MICTHKQCMAGDQFGLCWQRNIFKHSQSFLKYFWKILTKYFRPTCCQHFNQGDWVSLQQRWQTIGGIKMDKTHSKTKKHSEKMVVVVGFASTTPSAQLAARNAKSRLKKGNSGLQRSLPAHSRESTTMQKKQLMCWETNVEGSLLMLQCRCYNVDVTTVGTMVRWSCTTTLLASSTLSKGWKQRQR